MKYSEQLKLVVVQDYCSGNGSLKAVAKRHDVDISAMRSWIAAYKNHGVEGIKRKKRAPRSAEFKLSVLQRMWAEDLSYRQAAALYDIRKFDTLKLWEQQYDAGGLKALIPLPKGPRKAVPEPSMAPTQIIDDKTLTREQLFDELCYLRAENAYLKKLDALVQEKRQSALQKKRKSSLS